MPLEIILHIISGILGTLLSFQDFKTQKVGVVPLFSFAVACVSLGYFTREFCIMPFLIFSMVGLITHIFKKKQAFGTADYIVVFAISFVLPSVAWPLFIILCGILGILFSLLYKKRQFPFIPAIFMASVIVKTVFGIIRY